MLHVLNGQFSLLCSHQFSGADILKELCKIVNVIGLKDNNLPPELFLMIATALCPLVTRCDQVKIQGMVLRIFRGMFYDFNIEILSTSTLDHFCSLIVHTTLRMLERENLIDIANEDLYNEMEILKAAWMKYRMILNMSAF